MRYFNPKTKTEAIAGVHDLEGCIELEDDNIFFSEIPDGMKLYYVEGIPVGIVRAFDQDLVENAKALNEGLSFLEDTDWYVARAVETGVPIPKDVRLKRQEARERISNG